MKQTYTAIQAIEKTSQIIFWGMTACLILCVSMYMYFVNKTVWNVVARQDAESQIIAINSDLSATEFEYINNKANVTVELAQSLGFKVADKQTLFVTRETGPKSVALR